MLADEAGGHANLRVVPIRNDFRASVVRGIDPVDGWRLLSAEELDGDGFWTTLYIARGPAGDALLPVSRFDFTPSQDRFAWLVRHGFPTRPGKILGPWNDTDIEAAIAVEKARP